MTIAVCYASRNFRTYAVRASAKAAAGWCRHCSTVSTRQIPECMSMCTHQSWMVRHLALAVFASFVLACLKTVVQLNSAATAAV
jgi:hypothetical protein